METLKSAHIHPKCQSAYNRQSSIDEVVKAKKIRLLEGKRTVKDAQKFNFEALCFFCGEVCNRYKQQVHLVTNASTRQNIIDVAEKRKASDIQCKHILARLNNAPDLIEVNARYHSTCMANFYTDSPSTSVGRPASESTKNFIEYTIKYIKNNVSECQFSINEIKVAYTDDPSYKFPDVTTIKSKLKEHFSNEIVCHTNKRNDLIVLYKMNITKELAEDWYEKRFQNYSDEALRIVEMAAKLTLEEIRSTCYVNDEYIIPDLKKENLFNGKPRLLKAYLDVVIKSYKEKKEKIQWRYDKQIATISDCIVSAARPRSFTSPILLGVSSMLHKKYASKGLIDSMANIGLISPYKEVLKFEASINHDSANHTLTPDSYIQFVYDNADHNTCTIDGKNTFHAMGGIMIVTPESSVISKKTIKKLNKIPSSADISKAGFVELKHFEKKNSEGLKSITIENVYSDNSKKSLEISMQDFIWFYSKFANKFSDGWNGFMQKVHLNFDYEVSKIITVPFVNNPPSDYDTILTVLIESAAYCKNQNQTVCFVTFDQPLWYKCREILSSVDPESDPHYLSCIRARLGGFHLLMSFLGGVGNIMESSGLREAFCEIYAENSADKALTGHAYSRSVRGHFLVQLALTQIMLSSMEITDIEKAKLDALLLDLGKENFAQRSKQKEIVDLKKKFIEHLKLIKERGKTSTLWLQYWEIIALIKDFIRAERSGNWDLHLTCVERMIPYFHASGHFLYAKSAHLYLQDMRKIRLSMSEYEFELFTTQGFFTIRRTHKFWSGVWTDMIIEQVLMRSIKTQGGLTHGRGWSDSVLSKFVLTMIILVDVCNEMENFCDISFATTEQHLDSKEYRVKRDVADLERLSLFFNRYDPFPVTENIISIYSGIVGDKEINCYKAREVGEHSMELIIGNKFGSVKFQRKNKVLSLKAVHSSVKVNGEKVVINPLLLFQRISLNINSKDDMKDFLQYELAPFPLSLFTENGIRKNKKSELYSEFTTIAAVPFCDNVSHVVDGGFLLHKVIWKKNDTIEEITNKYFNYVKSHYAANTLIVFDGYPYANQATTVTAATTSTSAGTKQMERSRRKKSLIIPTFEYQQTSKIPFTQEQFLSNESNKDKLIKTISCKLESEGFICKQAAEDADALIINTAIQVAKQDDKTVIVVGQDIDLLILLHQLNSNGLRIFFHKPGSGNQKDEFYSSNCFLHESYTKIIAFIHAFSGCDSISGLAGKGKKTIAKSLLANKNLLNLASIFFEKDADHASIAQNGCQLIADIYQNKKISVVPLNTLRFELYKTAINKSSFKLEKLPPTEGAATQHSYRVYYQLQIWLSFFNELDSSKAKQWGWSERAGRLVPTFISDDIQLIPESLLKSISCSCESGCNKRCGCRKHGLKCTNLCINCHDNCLNREEITFENESDAEGIVEMLSNGCDGNSSENRGLEVDGDLDPSDSESCVDEET